MKILAALILSAVLFLGVAYAAETPPVIILDSDGITETPAAANYSWTYPAGNQDERNDVEACGMAPTDPAVLDSFDHIPLIEDRTFNVIWVGTPPDELTVFSWDTAVFSDQEHIDDYRENTEIVLQGKITLKPDRVCDLLSRAGFQPLQSAVFSGLDHSVEQAVRVGTSSVHADDAFRLKRAKSKRRFPADIARAEHNLHSDIV